MTNYLKRWFAHKHKWEELPWDKSNGKDFEIIDENYAAYKYLYGCKCGKKKIVEKIAFI